MCRDASAFAGTTCAKFGLSRFSPRYFSDLYRTILSFLDSLGFDSTPRLLVWDRYAFHPTERIVAFNDEFRLRIHGV